MFLVSSTIVAQTDKKPEFMEKTNAEATIEADANNWLVLVYLDNGSEVKGVVLQNRFIEKSHTAGLYYEIKNQKEEDAGLRLWFVRQTPGYVFIPYKHITKVQKIKRGKLTKETKVNTNVLKERPKDDKKKEENHRRRY
jgi:hypothetical protein